MATINSDKDIESIISKWNDSGFRLQKGFYDEKGNSESDFPKRTECELYRHILGVGPHPNESHRYALVNREGKIHLSVRLDIRYGASGFVNGDWILSIVRKYTNLKDRLNKEKIEYQPDNKFEEAITRAAADLITSEIAL
ncbi:MAG: hypothetical protein Q7S74_05870 [Nanoarchaeota archaeon]|nr:hypothetical protein [Nanoarchaeota archaeon]